MSYKIVLTDQEVIMVSLKSKIKENALLKLLQDNVKTKQDLIKLE
jgi:hypothetical protein